MPFAGLLRARRPGAVELTARLEVDGFGVLAAAVLATSQGAHALRIGTAPPVPVRFLHRRPARLEHDAHAADEGVVVAVADQRGGIRPDRLDFLLDGLREQRREFVRVPAAVPLTIAGTTAEPAPLEARTVDLSGGGALVRLHEGLPGQRVRVRLELPEHPEPVSAGGAVVRVTEQGLRALRLDIADPRDRERIVAFVTARQRELLRLTRLENPYR